MKLGDAIFFRTVKDERKNGSLSYKAPDGKRFVFLLIGTVDVADYDFDVDAALNDLGWKYSPKDEQP